LKYLVDIDDEASPLSFTLAGDVIANIVIIVVFVIVVFRVPSSVGDLERGVFAQRGGDGSRDHGLRSLNEESATEQHQDVNG